MAAEIRFSNKAHIRAVFAIMIPCTCGLAIIPWIVYEIVTAGKH